MLTAAAGKLLKVSEDCQPSAMDLGLSFQKREALNARPARNADKNCNKDGDRPGNAWPVFLFNCRPSSVLASVATVSNLTHRAQFAHDKPLLDATVVLRDLKAIVLGIHDLARRVSFPRKIIPSAERIYARLMAGSPITVE